MANLGFGVWRSHTSSRFLGNPDLLPHGAQHLDASAEERKYKVLLTKKFGFIHLIFSNLHGGLIYRTLQESRVLHLSMWD